MRDDATCNAVHGAVGRPAAGGARRPVRRLGLRRAGGRLLGGPLRRRRGGARPRLRRRAARAARATRPRLLGDRQPPCGSGGVRPDRRAPQERALAGDLGRRRPGGRPRPRRRGDDGHRARGGPAGRHRRHRIHGLADVAHALLVPAERLRRDRTRLPGVRRALGADHRRLRGRGRAVRARGASDRDRLRLRYHAQGARRDRRPSRVRHQLRPEPLRAPVPRLGGVHHGVRRQDLPRAHQGLRQAPGRPLVDPRRSPPVRRARARVGLRLAGSRRRRLRVDDPGAQPDRLLGTALDRVGGLGHGSGVGSARRARVRAAHGLRAVRGGVRRGLREGGLMSEVGFMTMGRGGGGEDVPAIGVGMLGYAFMGKAHTNAYKKLPYFTWPPPFVPNLVAIAGRNEEAVAEAARRYGYAGYVTDWHELLADDRIQLFDNAGPNDLHSEPTIAAAQAGKHVICEKPLGRDAGESYETWQRVAATGVKHLCAFNYRFVPAVRLARQMLEAGELGEIFHFRGRYLQEWIVDPDFPMVWRLSADVAGSGALGDLGAHVVDLARYLVGDIDSVSAVTKTFIEEREGQKVDVDDAFEAVVTFADGAVGTIEASRFCPGRRNGLSFEVNGSKGSIAFDLERL